MTEWVWRLPFSLEPLIAEARRRMKRRRVLFLALTVVLVGGSVGAVLAAQAPDAAAHTARPRAFFSVQGNAPRGVTVSYADDKSPMRVVESGSVPLHANVSKQGVAFYEFRARLLTPGGHITCKLRLGSEVVVGHASGTSSLCVVKARVSRGAVTGGASDRASFAALKPAPKPAVTAAMVAAAHRDEARMLRLFVPPTGAQRLAHEPVLLRRLGTKIFGIGPTSSDKFARFANWRVRSSVAAVARFELGHQPPGAEDQGCPHTQTTPLDRLCGVGLDTAKDVPTNASLMFLFPRIHGLVGERELRVSILKLPGGWTGIRLAATNHTWIPRKFRHRAPLPVGLFVQFIRTPGHPVAGRVFTGIKLVVADPKVRKIRGLRCTAALGSKVLRAREKVSFAASPPAGVSMAHSHGSVEVVACSWRIPANSAGQRLRLRNYSEYMLQRNSHLNPRAIVLVEGTKSQPPSQLASPVYSWVVRASRS